MAQTFSRTDVLLIKLTLLALLGGALLAFCLVAWSMRYPIAVEAEVRQPVPFSHKHHVGDDGIDCRYCHTTVETSASAGMPSAKVCMSCHSQLFTDAPVLEPVRQSFQTGQPLHWLRVHDLPDFVYFNHSIHVAKGVACVQCHGRVDQMPLMRRVASLDMQWCLACHRNPGSHLVMPQSRVFDPHWSSQPTEREVAELVQAYHLPSRQRMTDCSTCHR